MTVKTMFEEEHIEADFIEANFEGSYWESANAFVEKHWMFTVDGMSPKKLSWLRLILDTCIEKRIKMQ